MIKIQPWITQDEIVAVLNAEPPSPAAYARFVKAYWRGSKPYAARETLTQLSSALREWEERVPSAPRAPFLSNYLALAPTFQPRPTAPRKGWQLPATIARKQSRLIGAALVSAHLRTLVDEWLETGRDRNGSEWPSRRDPRQALSACQVASEFLEQSPPSLYPSDKGFGLTIAEPHWARPWAVDFFAAQEIDAARLFVAILADEWLERLCKCRYPPCGRYFVGAKIRRSYRHGTFCSRAHRARASADAVTKARRQQARCALVEAAAHWLAGHHQSAVWQDDQKWKALVAAELSEQMAGNPNFRAGSESVGVKWVTRNRTAIERRRVALSGRKSGGNCDPSTSGNKP